ncbi:MAG TPA: hypothetical protein VHY58_02565 [Streptosporangiaceae bacterium]|nr:hypothetical protein [Streptosporangiaceae bacterium]
MGRRALPADPARRAGGSPARQALATTADIAHAVSFPIEGDFVTGTVLHAEGGQPLL